MPEPDRTERMWERLDRFADPSSAHAVRLALGLALFGLVAVASAISFEELSFRPGWILAVVALAGMSMIINTHEYRVAARSSIREVSFANAARIAVAGSAANLLPLPGAALTRVQGLRSDGVATKLAIRANVLIGVVWLGMSAMAASLAFVLAGSVAWSIVGLAASTAFLVSGWQVANRHLAKGAFHKAIWVEFSFVLVSVARFYAATRSVGFESTFAQALVAPFASAAASAAGILPGGLGLRELLTGLLGAGVGIPVSAAAFASSFDRLAGITVLSVSAALLWRHSRTRRSAQP